MRREGLTCSDEKDEDGERGAKRRDAETEIEEINIDLFIVSALEVRTNVTKHNRARQAALNENEKATARQWRLLGHRVPSARTEADCHCSKKRCTASPPPREGNWKAGSVAMVSIGNASQGGLAIRERLLPWRLQ